MVDRCGLLKLPSLETFQYGPIEDISFANDSIASGIDVLRDNDADETDIWTIVASGQHDASKKSGTWEQLSEKDFQESHLYLSEATQGAWNSAWIRQGIRGENGSAPVPIKHDSILRSLVDLGLGFSSYLFTFDAAGKSTPLDDILFSGLSTDLTLSVIQTIGACGESFRMIERSLDERVDVFKETPSMIALVSTVRRVSNLTRQQISRDSSSAYTILQIHNLFQRPCILLLKLRGLLTQASQFETETALINHVVYLVEDHESHDQWFYSIISQILRMVINSFLEDISVKIGLLPEYTILVSRNPSLDHLFEKVVVSNGIYTTNKELPDLFDIGQELLIYQLHQSLKVLKTSRPDRLLISSTRHFQGNHIGLELADSWDDISDIHARAVAYEASGSQLRKYGSSKRLDIEKKDLSAHPLPKLHFSQNTREKKFQLYILESINECNLLEAHNPKSDPLVAAVGHALQPQPPDTIAFKSYPPIAVLMIESFAPLLSAQARLINHHCLSMIFRDCHLLHHLDVLHEFHLLGSGIFTTKLKQALFSPELSSTERRKGHHRSGNLGLRLGSRSAWPPASAEMRLALMGMLGDCYRLSFPAYASKSPDHLPGDLAFAIRNLSEPEIEACMDSTSLAALDFLRLQYKSHHGLNVIFHEKALSKYDRIFRFLLRLSRASFAVDQIWMQQRLDRSRGNLRMSRFIFEARHFIQALVAHVHFTISSIWHRFYRLVTSMENQVSENLSISSSTISHGIFQLSALHDFMLDKIMFELLLRQRHEKVMQVLNRILTSILDMASTSKPHAQLISDFQTNVTLIIAVCRNLSDRSDYNQQDNGVLSNQLRKEWSRGADSDDGLKNLILSLDMNGWYSKHDNRS